MMLVEECDHDWVEQVICLICVTWECWGIVVELMWECEGSGEQVPASHTWDCQQWECLVTRVESETRVVMSLEVMSDLAALEEAETE